MPIAKNTAQIWDSVWADQGIDSNYQLILAAEATTIRWQRIQQRLAAHFRSLKNLKVVEIGAGSGTYGALFAGLGAKVTLLDYSPKALARAQDFFTAVRLKAEFVEANALKLPPKLKQQFDVSISVGLTEHFQGSQRLQIHKAHLDVLKPGGVAIMIVPNAYNPPYRIFKTVSEVMGTWQFGEEYPYTRRELLSLPNQLNGKLIDLFGDDLYSSLKFVLPANFLRRWFGVGSARSLAEVRPQQGSPLDDYLSYSLILMIKKW